MRGVRPFTSEMEMQAAAAGDHSRIEIADDCAHSCLPPHKIASMPLRRITFNSTRAGPVGCFVPRSNFDT
jgi:hypothetical protein